MYDLFAEFPRQPVCRDRQYAALIRWASGIAAQPLPPAEQKPAKDWAQQRMIAERIPTQTLMYVDLTMSYTLKDNGIQTNIREHLSPWNNEAAEAAMDAQVDAALTAQMPAFCASQITQAMVDQWYIDNGYGDPATLAGPPLRTNLRNPLNNPM